MAALIESIFFGDEVYPEQPEAIIVWLSDSPQLNEQSKDKIDLKADKIRLGQCVTVQDDSFDQEMFDDGHIYFLNTQKLGKSSNLTKHTDNRQYTIWETLANTARDKSDRLYFIIDEAHRGMQGREAGRATTIMAYAYNQETRAVEQHEVYNGEIGLVLMHPFDQKNKRYNYISTIERFQVAFSNKNRQRLRYNYGREYGRNDKGWNLPEQKVQENLELAYAISVHKSQGSEFDYVYIVIPKRDSHPQ